MTPLQPRTNPVGSLSTDVSLGNPIPPFTSKDIFVTKKHNRLLDVINSILKLRLQRGPSDGIFLSKGGLTIQIAASAGASGGGGVNYRGEYDASVEYSVFDLVYTQPDSNTRLAWIAEIANGPTAGVNGPTWPEPGTVFWRSLNRSAASGIFLYEVDSHGTGSDTDYVWAHLASGGSSVKVLKPPLIQFSITTRNGVSYDTYNSTDQTRAAHNAGVTVTQYITPKYVAGDLIHVATIGSTLCDLNADARTFAAP